MAEVQAETRKVKIDKEFIVKIKGEVETDMTDEKIKWCLDTMDKELEDIIREEIIEDAKVSVKAIVRCKDCINRKTEDCAMYYRCNCGEQHTWENDNNFCSYGERKDG